MKSTVAQTKNDKSTHLDTITDCVDTIPINPNHDTNTNNDKLIEQVLALQRTFCPIDLKNDQILQNDNYIINGTL